MIEGLPAPGKRVRQVLPEYKGTDVHHALYLPTDWVKEKKYPVIAAIIIGGTSLSGGEGRIFGTVIGALIMGVLANGLNIAGVEPFWQLIAQGLVLIAAIIIDRQLQDGVMNMKKAK